MTIMATVDTHLIEDLEDGEIESDSEQAETPAVAFTPQTPEPPPLLREEEKTNYCKNTDTKQEKKKVKDHHSRSDREHKAHKDKSRKLPLPTPVEDDFAGNIEKAIRMALKKGNDDPKKDDDRIDNAIDDQDARRKHKKRKKHGQSEKESTKKRRKRDDAPAEEAEEMDEDEMMCIRGASPVMRQAQAEAVGYSSEEEYGSGGDSDESRGSVGRGRGGRTGRGRGSGGRERRLDRGRERRPRRQDTNLHQHQDPDGVCLFYMQGKCYKGDECPYSHDALPPRKMELCKFYLKDCCAKRDKCLYLHSDFPCKYYHTGLPCISKDNCKFAHGKPLSDNLRMILLKHIESAPKEILGDFPRLNRESASMMIASTQNKLAQTYSSNKSSNKDKNSIPSIFELNIQKPSGMDENPRDTGHDGDKKSSKMRSSRWCDSKANKLPLLSVPVSNAPVSTDSILSVQNLNGVLTPKQITDLLQLGIENLTQLSQLTVIQLNQLGLTMNQINDIQLNTMNIQKLGLINNKSSNSNPLFSKWNKDHDMRVSPVMTELSLPSNPDTGKDVDMRFQTSNVAPPMSKESSYSNDPRKAKPSLDVDQYTKDALKYSQAEKEESGNSGNNKIHTDIPGEKDIDHRVLQYISDATTANVKLSTEDENEDVNSEIEDTKISSTMNQNELYSNIQTKDEQKARRITTDDEEDNLQIDEKWYSSDEERNEKVAETKIKSPPQEEPPPKFYSPVDSSTMEPTTVITKLGDLSKIDISAEVTKLLSKMKNNSSDDKDPPKKEESKLRDPRSLPKKSPERRSPSDVPKKVASKPPAISIYNCIEGGNTETRKKADIDLRPIQDLDFRLPAFGDTDLRQTPGSGDVDLRLGLPFKPLPNYTPASEIDGSYSSHPPIAYKVVLVNVPRPDYTDIRNSTPKSQASSDPRLRKIFRLSLDENPSEVSEKPKAPSSVRSDPRKKPQESTEKHNTSSPKPSPLDLQAVIQTSNWYKELSSNQKILINQQLASVTLSLKKFHQDKTPGKVFDLAEIHSNNVLSNTFANLGIILNEKGEMTQVQVPEAPAPATNLPHFNPGEPFGGMAGLMGSMGSMGTMGPPAMGNFDMRFQGAPDPRSAPGLLGIAPNIPHNFEGSFNGMPNFNNDNNFNGNFDNSARFNGPGGNGGGNDYRNDNKYEEKYYRGQKNEYKSSYRGNRGNDRWRGSRGRERRGYSERGRNGGWKGERR